MAKKVAARKAGKKLARVARQARAAAKKERAEAVALEIMAKEVEAVKALPAPRKTRDKTSWRMAEDMRERIADVCPRCGGEALGGRFRYRHLETCPYRARSRASRRSIYQ